MASLQEVARLEAEIVALFGRIERQTGRLERHRAAGRKIAAGAAQELLTAMDDGLAAREHLLRIHLEGLAMRRAYSDQ